MNKKNSNPNINEEVIELDYQAPTIGRNLSGRFFDMFIFVLLGIILIVPMLFVVQSNKTYQSWQTSQDNIKIESRLYEKNSEGKIVSLPNYFDSVTDLTWKEKSDKMEESLTYFFSSYVNTELNDKGMEEYLSIKSKLTFADGSKMFADDGKRTIDSVDYENKYYNAYCSIIKNNALGYLNLKDEYLSLKKKSSLTYLIGIPLMFALSYIIIYYIFPLCFSRGKRTPGMLLTKTSLLSVDGFSCKAGKFTIRFLIKFFLIFIGSFVAVFIPFAVSITMIVATKSHQSLSEYITNTYMVLSAEQSVYKDLTEYQIAAKSMPKSISHGINFKK